MLNKCCFIGNLGRDAEVRSLPNGGEVANLSLGVSESYKRKDTGEKVEKTEWVRVTVFNENIVKVIKQYTAKGDKIYIEGKLATRKFTNKDGAEQYVTEVVLGPYDSKLVLLGSPKGGQAAASSEPAPTPQAASSGVDADEIPF